MENKVKCEEKMLNLESIINDLENGEIDMDESIEKYTKAMMLVKECDNELKNVEEQVSKLVSENGETQDFSIDE